MGYVDQLVSLYPILVSSLYRTINFSGFVLMNKKLLTFFVLILLSLSVIADDFEDAERAYISGDYSTAFILLKEPAEQGVALAQHNLGVMYQQGLGVTQDLIEAYKWHNIALANGMEKSRDIMDLIVKLMTPIQIESARKLAREWMDKHQQ